MKRVLLLTIIALGLVAGGRAESTIDRLIANINEMTLQSKAEGEEMAEEFITVSDHGKYNDVMILELYVAVTISDREAEKYITSLKPDGSWGDIDYTDKKPSRWDPAMHITRIHSIAKAYKTPKSKYYNSPEASAALHKALNFWFDAKLVCSNWWYNEIGGPKMLGPALLLLKDELTADEKQKGEAVLAKAVFKMTGQNKVWLSGNILMRGLLSDNLPLVEQARDSIVSEIFVSTAEGLQPDYSFHQHGAQMQFGNYGLAYAGTISYWARVLKGTPLAVSPEQIGYLRKYLLDGLMWTVWRGYMDVNACARQVFKDAQRGKALSVAVTAINMMKVDPDHAEEYKRYVYRNLIDPKSINLLDGHKCFPRSDYAIHRTASWYASVRMHSNRLLGYEMTNRENLQGIYASDGTMILLLDGDEYNNIYPVWNWKRLPGTTVADDGKAIEFSHPRKPVNLTDFAGGVTDGDHGISAMEIAKNGLTARKSYFFIDHAIVCTGSGITSAEPLPIFTTLNQTLLKGDVAYGAKGHLNILAPEQSITQTDIEWVHHNQVGYVMLQDDNVTISNKTQRGTWSSIAQFYGNDTVSAKVFSTIINHGTKSGASYAYAVLPFCEMGYAAEFSKTPKVKVLSNTTKCQSVSNTDGSMEQYVFFEPSTVKTSNGSEITALTTGMLMMESTTGYSEIIAVGKPKIKKGIVTDIRITASDPTQKLDEIKFVIAGKLNGNGAVYNPKTKSTTVTIALPTQEGFRGGSVTALFNR